MASILVDRDLIDSYEHFTKLIDTGSPVDTVAESSKSTQKNIAQYTQF